MRVLLINPPYKHRTGGSVVEPIGLLSLAASLREDGFEVDVLDLDAMALLDKKDYRDILMGHLENLPSPELIGIGPLVTASIKSTLNIIEQCKKHTNAPVVLGGPLCSAPHFGEVSINYFGADAWVAGDGEDALKEIARSIADDNWARVEKLPGVGVHEHDSPAPQRIEDLDRLPVPARDVSFAATIPSARRSFDGRKSTAAFLSRGCPYACTFCAAPLVSGRKVRRFSPERISEEIRSCLNLGYENIVFYDDCLFVRGARLDERVLEFTGALDRAGWQGTYQLEFRCDALMALSEKAMDALIRTGLRQVNMGIEKGHLATLKQLRKRLEPETARLACERLRSSGVRAAGTFILGGSGESIADIDAVIGFATSLPLTYAHFNPLALYPGTALYNQTFGEDAPWLRLCLDEDWAPNGDILWRSSRLPLEEISKGLYRAYKQFYTPERLQEVTIAIPDREKNHLTMAYALLGSQRAASLVPSSLEEC